jgi:hypothetical protein
LTFGYHSSKLLNHYAVWPEYVPFGSGMNLLNLPDEILANICKKVIEPNGNVTLHNLKQAVVGMTSCKRLFGLMKRSLGGHVLWMQEHDSLVDFIGVVFSQCWAFNVNFHPLLKSVHVYVDASWNSGLFAFEHIRDVVIPGEPLREPGDDSDEQRTLQAQFCSMLVERGARLKLIERVEYQF